MKNNTLLIFYNRDLTGKQLKIICYRDRIRDARREIEHSLVLKMCKLPTVNLKEGIY